MSTPDGLPRGPAHAPGELSLHAPQRTLPSSPAALPSSTPSPGVGSAVLRSPTAPTLPDADPGSLTLAIAHLANVLFADPAPPAPSIPSASTGTPPASAPASSTLTLPASTPAAPTQPASTTSPPTATAPTTSHPFSSTPDFSGVFASTPSAPGLPDAFAVPLVDAFDPPSRHAAPAPSPSLPSSPQPSTLPSSPAPTSTAPFAPSSPAPTSTAPFAPSSPSASLTVPVAYEVTPVVDTGLRSSSSSSGFDAAALKAEFPILQQRVHGKPLVWLDNAATTQKPRAVIERLKRFYEHENSNIHRAAHALAARATDAYEHARETVRRFVNASSVRDVIFVRGTTEGINLVAQSWGRQHIGEGDEIVLTHLEHHANIVPWQLLARDVGARLKIAPVDDDGQIVLPAYERLLTDRVKLVAMTQVSNALGTVTPAAAMIAAAKRRGIPVLLDGAQSVSHQRVDLQQLQPDFFVFSGHKIFGPTGIGVVVAPHALMDDTPPWQGGGNMIADVTFERTLFQPAPARFEAGTGNIADAVGLGAALDWVTRVGIESIGRHEHDLLVYGTERLRTVPGLTIIGTAAEKAGVLSFVVDGHDTHAIAQALDKDGIAVRGGHHCAQPILRRFGLQSTVRASLAPYNTHEDLDALVDAVCRIVARGA
ncbi:MAG: SufS family cysteine desulfurase [Deltaproteobacteria bacterium]|nr:SufS family cysteine desulfurase [Deltaproteobacteria bacterium]